MFKFIEQACTVSSSFSGTLPIKCISLNESCLVRPVLIDFNPNKRHYNPFMVRLDRRSRNCNTLDDAAGRICVPNKTENVNLNVFNMLTRINESKILTEHISCDCK